MRQLYTTAELRRTGLTFSAIRSLVKNGRLTRVIPGVYVPGAQPPSPLEEAAAVVAATAGVASGCLAGVLLQLDGVELCGPDVTVSPSASGRRAGVRRRALPAARIVTAGGVRCTDGLQTLVDLAAIVDDGVWEQALECVLRRRWATVEQVEQQARGTTAADARMRRVLTARPVGAPPTESLLETLMIQLARRVPGLPPPERQYLVRDPTGHVRARLDLAWPELGLFVELDGEHHRDQRVSDRQRETEIVALTGWLCGRFTWADVVKRPSTTVSRLAALAAQARRRAVPAGAPVRAAAGPREVPVRADG